MIPKTIHQIWIGNLEPPISLMNSWKNKNPNFKYILWDEHRIREEKFASQVKIDEIEEYCGKADIIRYEILNRYGGVYVDADSYCIEKLDNFLFETSFAVYENEKIRKGLVATGVLGFEANHPLLSNILEIINKIPVSKEETGKKAWQTVGPLLFTKIYNKTLPKIKIYPSFMFYPEHYTGLKYEGHGKSFAYQFWGSTKSNYEIIDEIDVPPWLFELPETNVSIFMIVNNESFDDFKKSMDSIINQDGNLFIELIIFDNHIDGDMSFELWEEISKYKKITKNIRVINITHFIRVSLGRALNFCFQRASGDYITFCFLGDVLHSDKLFQQMNYLHNTGDCVVGTQVRETMIFRYSKDDKITSYPSISINTWREKRNIDVFDRSTLMFTKEFLRQEKFNEAENYPCIMAKGLEAFIIRSYLHNLKSVMITRKKKVTENYVYRFFTNSNLERQLLQDILQ